MHSTTNELSLMHHHRRHPLPSTGWTYQPSFYNGYTTNAPIAQNRPVNVIHNYTSPIEQQQQQLYHHQQQQQYQKLSQLSPIVAPVYHSSLKSSGRLRNAFSCSNQQQTTNSDDEFLYHEQQLNHNLELSDAL